MQGLMQAWGLTLDKIITHANTWHPDQEVVTRSVEGPIVRSSYGLIYDRARRISHVLESWGIGLGDRVATLAWNTARHMEVWYGVMGIGAVCHTLNPRLFPQQLAWIINHAEDKVIFTDLTFLPLLDAILPHCPTVKRVVIMTDEWHMPSTSLPGAECYEALLKDAAPDCVWGQFDENTAAGLCYTSGTTGNPKGVLYSHRSNFLHTYMCNQADTLGASIQDTLLPVVPMFHANAWGVAFSGPAVGAKLVMPGAKMDGASIYELLETEKCTLSAAVPTVWQMLLQYLTESGKSLGTLKKVTIGGAAVPESLIRAFHSQYGVQVCHAWGMTETSPLGTVNVLTPEVAALPFDQQVPSLMKQGRPPLGVEMKIEGPDGTKQPHDGKAFGHLKVRGPAVARTYYRAEAESALDAEGFFDTGDVATLDAQGYMQITDRAKDVIKSGGEWISSIEIENLAVGHPKAILAAVVGVPHPKWDERPLLLVKLKTGETATPAEFQEFLSGKIAKWWMPDDVVFIDEMPMGSTGKIDKKTLRQQFSDYKLPSVPNN
ncbi:MAG: long-chain-fatty-acid--CoA ligase [Asticcacaulis sp.]